LSFLREGRVHLKEERVEEAEVSGIYMRQIRGKPRILYYQRGGTSKSYEGNGEREQIRELTSGRAVYHVANSFVLKSGLGKKRQE